ncbi:MAG TPA: FAD-binding oxidoreductase, partial [Candidatus Acidoferrales bacterium]|nr:FAD-binding oxidoreductase [Candidatus Acidoferrales bacterium]
WGVPPWHIDFAPQAAPLPKEADFVVIGAGFTGLAAAAWLRLLAPDKTTAVLEASRVGAGASGRTGGMVLSETAAGDVPDLGDVLAGFREILVKLEVECDLAWPGAWEIGRSGGAGRSPIEWNDSGKLRVMNEVPGGTLDPGKLTSGLARSAQRWGAGIFENARVENIDWNGHPLVHLAHAEITAGKILFATNALSTGLSGLAGAEPRLTLAVSSEPLREEQLREIGLGERKPFYTIDFPYLWGRVRPDNSVIWGSGLVAAPGSRNLASIDITSEDCRRLIALLEARVRGLHPALSSIGFTHRWGGPILFRESWVPVFDWHPHSVKKSRKTTANAIVLGAYAGHGVALSSYLGAWAAEALLGRRDLPEWGRIDR